MKLTAQQLFSIISVAYQEMEENRNDYKNTYPVVKEIAKKMFTDWYKVEEFYLDKLPF